MEKDEIPKVIKPEDLPEPIIEYRSRNYRRRKCPKCGKGCYRDSKGHRTLHDLGDLRTGKPHDIKFVYSKHRCETDKIYFNTDMSDIAPIGSNYTHRVVTLAVQLVIEDGLPLRSASWHLWRDHKVYVPFGTVQNWIEDAGKKNNGEN